MELDPRQPGGETTYWVVVMMVDSRDNSGDVELDRIISTTPKDTGTYIHMSRLALSTFGCEVYLIEADIWDAARRDSEVRDGKMFTKEQAHKDLWARMRKRGEILKRRRKKKGNGK